MKIGIDISQIVYGTGVSNYTSQLVEHLAEIDKRNQYILFGGSLRGRGKFKELADKLTKNPNFNFKIVSIPPTLLEFLWNRLHIFPIEKFISKIDIFHSSDWTQPPIRSKNTRKITTVHDMISFLFPSSSHPKILAVQKRRFKLVKHEVDLIIADSNTTKQDLIKFQKIPQEKIRVIPLAASPIFKPQDDQKVKEILLKYNIKKPYILSVATQEPRKNIQRLQDSFEKIHQKYPELLLVLTGKHGWGQEPKINKNVINAGFIPQEDLPPLYSGCRVFVYVSLYEGFGLPVLEAMACGAPVITSNNSSMAEIAKDAAILIDPRNENQLIRAIEMVLNLNLENYQKMVRASLARARQYSWSKTAKETLEVYREVMRGN